MIGAALEPGPPRAETRSPDGNIATALREMARRRPDAIAVQEPIETDGEGRIHYARWSFRQLDEEVDRLCWPQVRLVFQPILEDLTAELLKICDPLEVDRRAKADQARLLEASGGKLLNYYITFGEYDFLIITEGGSEQDIIAALLTTASTGTVTDLRTVPAITSAEAKGAYEKAQALRASFRPAGGDD